MNEPQYSTIEWAEWVILYFPAMIITAIATGVAVRALIRIRRP